MDTKVKEQLEQLKGTASGQALLLYLEEEIAKMKDISGIKTIKELQAKQEAEKILTSLFKFLDFKAVKTAKSKYN